MNFKETFLDLIGSLRNIMKDDAVVTKICHEYIVLLKIVKPFLDNCKIDTHDTYKMQK